MDVSHSWCNLKPGVRDLDFVTDLQSYLSNLQDQDLLRSFRIMRSKLGLSPPQLREFHIMLDFDDLAQLQSAFDGVSRRTDPIEGLHYAVNSKVQDAMFALYRDFPDEHRETGQERF